VVTLVFTDIEGSSRLLDTLGSKYGDLLGAHRRLLREAFAERGGVEVDTQGDAFLVAFGDPRDAVLATEQVHASLAAREAEGHPGLRVRIGVHTGTPSLSDEGYWGPDVHYGARLASAAHGGQTIVSGATAALLGGVARFPVSLVSLGEHGFKDYPAPRAVFQAGSHRVDAFPPIRSLRVPRHRLPVVATSFVGRQEDVHELARLLHGQHPLISLVGAGGSGKTRLALETAHAMAPAFDDSWFVPLESTSSPEDLLPSVERALGLVESADAAAALTAFLRSRSALLVLDNLEHLLDAADAVVLLAQAGARVRVLVTSQAPLQVSAERVVRVSSLTTATDGARLIRDRAEAAGHPLPQDAATNQALERLVGVLEGMPLALELAGARLSVLSPDQLLRQLDRSLDALGQGARDLPARQRGMRAMLEWTCSLLSPQAADLLGGLAAFAADVDPEVAELAIPGALDGLQALLDVGLVVRLAEGRFLLRPPVRRFAVTLVSPDRLAEHHRSVCAALADVARPYERLWLVDNGRGRPFVDREQTNVLGALDWSSKHAVSEHDELAASVGWWGTHSSVAPTVRAHVDQALARAPAGSELEARLLAARGALGLADSEPSWCLLAADAFAQLGQRDAEVVNRIYAANLAQHGRTDPVAVVALAEDAMRGARTLPEEPRLTVMATSVLAQSLWYADRREEARAAQAAALEALAAADHDAWTHAYVTTIGADIALADGDPQRAAALYAACMHLLREVGLLPMEMLQAIGLTEALLAQGRTLDAAYAHAVSALAYRELGGAGGGFVNAYLGQVGERIDPALRGPSWDRAVEDGVAEGLLRAAELGES
jgi:class 3 adenylate cyclase